MRDEKDMRKHFFLRLVSLALAFFVLLGLVPAGIRTEASAESREITVGGVKLTTGVRYKVYLEPTADCDPSFTPLYVFMEFESENYCILSCDAGQTGLGRLSNKKYIDLFSTAADKDQALAINGKCDTNCSDADFAVRVSSFVQGKDALPVFGERDEGIGFLFVEPAPTAEPRRPAVYRIGEVTVTEREICFYRIVPDESCDKIFDPFTMEVKLFGDGGAFLIASHYKNEMSVLPLSYSFEDNGWIEFSCRGHGRFWGMIGPGSDDADYTIRVIGLEDNLWGRFNITGTRAGEEPVAEPEPALRIGDYDTDMYYYYGLLTDEEKAVYTQLLEAITACEETVELTVPVSNNKLEWIYWLVRYDQPQVFWSNSCAPKKRNVEGMVSEVRLYYNDLARNLAQEQERVEKAVSKVLDSVKGMNILEAERYVHDYLVKEATYVLGAPNNQNLYSALVAGETVCAGYTRAFQYIMQRLGVPCYYCKGFIKMSDDDDSGEGRHAWNLIRLEDGYYNVDITWDDSYRERNASVSYISYEFFNVTDSFISVEHFRDDDFSARFPACDSKGCSVEVLYGHNWQTETAVVSGIPAIGSLQEYFDLCYDELARTGIGESTSCFIATNAGLIDEIIRLKETKAYREGYLNRFRKSVNANLSYGYSCQFNGAGSRGDCYYVVLVQKTER